MEASYARTRRDAVEEFEVDTLLERLFYDRLFDRPSRDIHVDGSSLEWIREHEPRLWHLLTFATQRNGRRTRQVFYLPILMGLAQLAAALWAARFPDEASILRWSSVFSGLFAGLVIGLGVGALSQARSMRLLAMLKGETRQRES